MFTRGGSFHRDPTVKIAVGTIPVISVVVIGEAGVVGIGVLSYRPQEFIRLSKFFELANAELLHQGAIQQFIPVVLDMMNDIPMNDLPLNGVLKGVANIRTKCSTKAITLVK